MKVETLNLDLILAFLYYLTKVLRLLLTRQEVSKNMARIKESNKLVNLIKTYP